MQSMLSAPEVARRYNISLGTVWNYRRRGILPAPLQLSPKMIRWRAKDLDEHDNWIMRCADLRAKGADPEQALAPSYSLPLSTDEHEIGREIEASRHEPAAEDTSSDKQKIKDRIEHLRRQALKLCLDAGKPIPSELLEAQP